VFGPFIPHCQNEELLQNAHFIFDPLIWYVIELWIGKPPLFCQYITQYYEEVTLFSGGVIQSMREAFTRYMTLIKKIKKKSYTWKLQEVSKKSAAEW
jgi:hypothetical protein